MHEPGKARKAPPESRQGHRQHREEVGASRRSASRGRVAGPSRRTPPAVAVARHPAATRMSSTRGVPLAGWQGPAPRTSTSPPATAAATRGKAAADQSPSTLKRAGL